MTPSWFTQHRKIHLLLVVVVLVVVEVLPGGREGGRRKENCQKLNFWGLCIRCMVFRPRLSQKLQIYEVIVNRDSKLVDLTPQNSLTLVVVEGGEGCSSLRWQQWTVVALLEVRRDLGNCETANYASITAGRLIQFHFPFFPPFPFPFPFKKPGPNDAMRGGESN